MARPLRIDLPGNWHHVMNRGTARREVFVQDEDRHDFLELMVQCRLRWSVRTHAYVLMGNHYHLFLEDEHGFLSRSMRHLDGAYTQRFNRRHHRDGSLFRGRFASKLVQHERYGQVLVDYIHNNPVRAGLILEAEDYPWSSSYEASDEIARQFSITASAVRQLCLRYRPHLLNAPTLAALRARFRC